MGHNPNAVLLISAWLNDNKPLGISCHTSHHDAIVNYYSPFLCYSPLLQSTLMIYMYSIVGHLRVVKISAFCMVQIFGLFVFAHVSNRISSIVCYRYFLTAENALLIPSRTLSSLVSPEAIKQPN